MHHKIVAIRIKGTRDGVKLQALSQSPRGTKYPVASVSVDLKDKDREARSIAVEQGLAQIYPEPEIIP